VKRREFISLLGGAAASSVSWPLAVRAQQPAMPVIGFLRSAPLADATHLVTAFRQGLREAGFVEGQNVAIEFRSAENDRDRLSTLAVELIRGRSDRIRGSDRGRQPPRARCGLSRRTACARYQEGRDIVIEFRWADGRYERLPALFNELVRRDVDVIVTHGTPGVLAAKEATATIPIVMATSGDAEGSGLMASLARPGGT
jgi:hypothetical protein